ncbi:MAG: hypothetical protein HY904_10985 [Deltaproteobacteria bacterium]|nr:hypothetical protein [Deltaproteobacteria bacterium]
MTRGRDGRIPMLLVLVALANACAVRQIPLTPSLEPALDDKTPRTAGPVTVALVMDPRVGSFVRERDFSLTQEERYASGPHFIQSVVPHLRARGVRVLEVESLAQGQALGAAWVLIPDTPGVSVVRPKGLLDFSFLGSINRITVNYAVRAQKAGARVPERVAGSGTRTASFFWSNALLQTAGLGALGLAVTAGIYSAWFGFTAYRKIQKYRAGAPAGSQLVDDVKAAVDIDPGVYVAVLVADVVVSQLTAQVMPRLINPLVDLLINEPRWEGMVQAAHDDAIADLADNVVRKVAGKGAVR